MKSLGFVFLSFFITSSVHGMECTKEHVGSEGESLLDLTELRFLIMQAFFKGTTLEEALRTSKAWCLVDKTGSTLLQSPTATKDFIDYLEACLYETDLELSENLLKNFSSLLDKDSCSSCVSSLNGRDELISLLKECSSSSNWSRVSSKLAELKKNEWWNKTINYHWVVKQNSNQRMPIRANCLYAALLCHSPYSVIEELLKSKARTTSFGPSTPPPLVVLFEKLILTYKKLYPDSYECDIEALSLSEDPKEKSLKDLCDKVHLLLENKASLKDSYFFTVKQAPVPAIVTPLSLAASAHYLKLIEYLIKKGAVLDSPFPFIQALRKKADSKEVGRKFAVLKALIESSSDTSILLRTFTGLLGGNLLIGYKQEPTDSLYTKEEFNYAVELLIDRLISQKASPYQKKEALQTACACNNQEITNLLTEKGFAEYFGSDKKSITRKEFNERGMALLKLVHSKETNSLVQEAAAKEFFFYARDLLESDTIELEDIKTFIGFVGRFPLLEESCNLLLCLSAKEPFSVSIIDDLPVFTVLHFLVEMGKFAKCIGNQAVEDAALIKTYILVCRLMEKGVKDSAVNGKTAAEYAYESGFPQLGDCITYKLQDWLSPLIGMEPNDEEKVKQLFVSVNNLIAQGQANIVGMGPVFSYALRNFHLQEAKDFLLWAASQEPFCLKGIAYRDAPSVFHVLVEYLEVVKQSQPVDVYSAAWSKALSVVRWLKDEQGIDLNIRKEGKTAVERGVELGIFRVINHAVQ